MPPDPPPRLRNLRAGPFGVLDVGSTKVTCLIGRTESDGTLRVLGGGFTRSRGVRGGGITDLDEAERAIRAAVALAEDMADHRLRTVTVNLLRSSGEPTVQRPMASRRPSGHRGRREACHHRRPRARRHRWARNNPFAARLVLSR